MISEIYEPFDDESKRSMQKVQSLFESDVLMAGLGTDCSNYSIPETFNVITNIEQSYTYLNLEPDWDAPVLDHQYFEDINTAAVHRHERYEYEEVKRRAQPISKNVVVLGDYLYDELLKKIEKHGVLENLSALSENDIDQKRLEDIVKEVYPNAVAGHFMSLAEASLFGGVESWPIAHQFYKCFETGGMPAGWVGSLPAEGGLPNECMQLLHFGPQTKS